MGFELCDNRILKPLGKFDMNNKKQQIINARNERETGDPSKALEMFLQIRRDQLEPSQEFDYLGELGLTYWHLKKFEEAKATFEEAKTHAEKSKITLIWL